MDAMDNPSGVFSFPPGKFMYYSSEALLKVGGTNFARRALSAAEDSLEYFRSHMERSCQEFVAAAQLDAVSAHISLRDIDGALARLQEFIDVPAGNRTTPVLKRMDGIVRLLAGAGDKRAASLATQIREFGEQTANGGN